MSAYREFSDLSAEPAVRGFLHDPAQPNDDALVLTHGAGANCQSKLLIALADAFADAGYLVLRCDLPFRQSRPHGPPFPAMAARDREGLRRAVDVLRSKTPGRIFLGGHSYGGRQGSMLAPEQPQLVAGLLLLSYPAASSAQTRRAADCDIFLNSKRRHCLFMAGVIPLAPMMK